MLMIIECFFLILFFLLLGYDLLIILGDVLSRSVDILKISHILDLPIIIIFIIIAILFRRYRLKKFDRNCYIYTIITITMSIIMLIHHFIFYCPATMGLLPSSKNCPESFYIEIWGRGKKE